jgi:hypothetical protein
MGRNPEGFYDVDHPFPLTAEDRALLEAHRTARRSLEFKELLTKRAPGRIVDDRRFTPADFERYKAAKILLRAIRITGGSVTLNADDACVVDLSLADLSLLAGKLGLPASHRFITDPNETLMQTINPFLKEMQDLLRINRLMRGSLPDKRQPDWWTL